MNRADSPLPDIPEVSADLVAADLGLIGYDAAMEFQRRLHARVAARKGRTQYLLLLEHEPVITIGRAGKREHILYSEAELAARGVIARQAERGGDVTFHGPGQIVGYPIIDLTRAGGDVVGYLRRLESILISVLGEYNVVAQRRPGYTGVWVGMEKIAAIGVNVRKGVASHGFALNVSVDLDYFSLIIPCGIVGCAVTSMEKTLGRKVALPEIERRLIRGFACDFAMADVRTFFLQRSTSGAQWIGGERLD